ncbi:hypothetical protein [Acetobacterium woodii]|uniref:Ribbon-helix-helix protein CopG domain-containing protein n=1 Tax=Acetobacterium woodii (strain ATCC 29683 / DSM 1030 / JCM 2381 / KCTC 1655 / WB1) TaxID=931626 RepID=H6LDP1_ACEWD|nr:hypothetical protein [Acetobacterium woodii]AFA49205.1 hypothetical protein Awo_c24480 [Acetobacterium woodii DSM 1030]
MIKSVYSLMLFDEIVEKIDQIAYENNTNRSQLINDILAEKIGLVTPEQKIQKILEQLDENFSDTLSVSQINKNSSIQFGKSLKYKYRPKVRYSYEFISSKRGKYAVLKVSSRTKSENLNDHFDEFFKLITGIEKEERVDHIDSAENLTNHKFVRAFEDEAELTQDIETVTENLTCYLKMIDHAMNLYFAKIDKTAKNDLIRLLENIYREDYVKRNHN